MSEDATKFVSGLPADSNAGTFVINVVANNCGLDRTIQNNHSNKISLKFKDEFLCNEIYLCQLCNKIMS